MKALFLGFCALLLVMSPILALQGCFPVKNPTNALRAAVTMTAEAVRLADITCAEVGKEKKDVRLLTTCKDSYNIARPALVSAQYYIDLGDEAATEASLCTGVKALVVTANLIVAEGAKLPPLVTEAIRFAGSLCPAGATHA